MALLLLLVAIRELFELLEIKVASSTVFILFAPWIAAARPVIYGISFKQVEFCQ